MKKSILLLTILFTLTSTFGQKKKVSKSVGSSSLVKLNNLSVALIQNNLYLFIENKGAKKDTILLKKYDAKGNPTGCKITAFTTKGTPLHLISWSETSATETKEKTENKTMQYNEIWNIKAKTRAFSNLQSTTKIKEIQYLDKSKNASQTVDKIRNEG